MKKHVLAFFTAIILFTVIQSCKSRPGGSASDAGIGVANFVGPWIASSVDVAIDGKRDKSSLIHFDAKETAGSQNKKPAMTIFVADGSYREEVYNLEDSLLQSKAGFWHLFEDSLYMRVDGAGNQKLAFKATVEGRGLLLVSHIDWDVDGAKDDEMSVKLRRP